MKKLIITLGLLGLMAPASFAACPCTGVTGMGVPVVRNSCDNSADPCAKKRWWQRKNKECCPSPAAPICCPVVVPCCPTVKPSPPEKIFVVPQSTGGAAPIKKPVRGYW